SLAQMFSPCSQGGSSCVKTARNACLLRITNDEHAGLLRRDWRITSANCANCVNPHGVASSSDDGRPHARFFAAPFSTVLTPAPVLGYSNPHSSLPLTAKRAGSRRPSYAYAYATQKTLTLRDANCGWPQQPVRRSRPARG